jgi:mRNA-degrading endonuclease toxin of MazEF toxin-antitoxin module
MTVVVHPVGTILFVVNVLDPNGVNPKNRRVVLIRNYCDGDEFAYGVAITGEFDYPLTEDQIELPFQRPGGTRCGTGLTKESVAKCDWIVEADAADLRKRVGHLPPNYLNPVLARVSVHLAPPPAPAPQPPASPPTT